ncbi:MULTISPECIES: hypothetical protein [Niallia]|uniref:Uncharacterized protein n=1 Tax=Niallia circulans TaxID=1397 RepID=A0A941JL49_NIACI|nr:MULTISPECIES: hypothetical protein [Niallia]MCB5237193.1 hypothetical protein [Niallia circulans]MED3795643.1 hypothetical protein [Niallia alba]
MSRFGDGSYKQEIFDNLHWIIYNLKPEVLEPKEQLEFIHQNIIYLITKQYDKLNWFIKEEGVFGKQKMHKTAIKNVTTCQRNLILNS